MLEEAEDKGVLKKEIMIVIHGRTSQVVQYDRWRYLGYLQIPIICGTDMQIAVYLHWPDNLQITHLSAAMWRGGYFKQLQNVHWPIWSISAIIPRFSVPQY